MLQRVTTTPPVTAPGRLTGANSALLRYIVIVAALSVVGCLYFLQMNHLSDLHEQIIGLQEQAETLEQRNIELARQWARWNTPSYIEGQADAAAYAAPTAVIHVQPVEPTDSGPAR